MINNNWNVGSKKHHTAVKKFIQLFMYSDDGFPKKMQLAQINYNIYPCTIYK